MCNPTKAPPAATATRKSLLLSTKSFDCAPGEGSVGDDGVTRPGYGSVFFTMTTFITALCVSEQCCRVVFKDAHPLLSSDGLGYKILSRHVGVDFVSCLVVAILGIRNFHICSDMWMSFLSLIGLGGGKTSKEGSVLAPGGYTNRIFGYHAASQQILLYFLAYQIKNLYDSIMWNDGPEYIFHHIAAGSVAWMGMYPGFGHYYVIFFMGLSELSTAVLLMLANFDDEHGVPGFSEAFPLAKIILGVAFVVSFIICRAVMWPYAAYHFVKDCRNAVKEDSERARVRKPYLQGGMVLNIGLSILQVAWLGQIYVIGKEEVGKFMEQMNNNAA